MKNSALFVTTLLAFVLVPATCRAQDVDSKLDRANILFLADSHGVLPFGAGVEDALRKIPGVTVDTYAIGASQPESFLKGFTTTCGYHGRTDNQTPPAKRDCRKTKTPLIKNVARGQITVVALGTNQLYDPRGWDFAAKSIERLVTVIQQSGSRCVWIGPPKMRRFTAEKLQTYYDLLPGAVRGDTRYPPCEIVDSRLFTNYPPKIGDGIHYGWNAKLNELGKAWGLAAGQAAVALIQKF